MVFMVTLQSMQLAVLWCEVPDFSRLRRVSTTWRDALADKAQLVLDQFIVFIEEKDNWCYRRALDAVREVLNSAPRSVVFPTERFVFPPSDSEDWYDNIDHELPGETHGVRCSDWASTLQLHHTHSICPPLVMLLSASHQ